MTTRRRNTKAEVKGGREFTLIDVKIRGIRPLLQNDSFDEEDTGTAAKKGKVYDDQEEAEKRLIKGKDGDLCQKATHLEGAMIKSAVEFKFQGQKTYKELFKAGIFVEPLLIPHLITEWVIDRQQVKIGSARIMRCRPRFDEWGLKFQIRCADDRIQLLVLKQILENAGFYVGIGDYRPRYGLFEVIEFNVNGT